MRPSNVLLIQLALLASRGHAFFPFQPEWLKEIEDHDASVQPESVQQESVALHAVVHDAASPAEAHVGTDNGPHVGSHLNPDAGSHTATHTAIHTAIHTGTPVETHAEEDAGADALTFRVRRRARLASGSPSHSVAWQASAVSHKYVAHRHDALNPDSRASTAQPLSKRDGNQFAIMQAANPNQKRTAGVDQDGADYAYFIQAYLGSQSKPMYMLIDTGAGSSWVMGTDCMNEACLKHNRYGPADSQTLEMTSDNFTISYGSGAVKGTLVNDTIRVADMSLEYEFGLAASTSDDFVHFAFDGILGLSRSSGDSQNFMRALADAKMLDKNIFSMALTRASDGTNFGEITFGSTDPAKYTGDIGYTSTPSDGDDWKIILGDMGFAGTNAGVGNVLAWIDSGTSYIFGPPRQVKALHALIPGAESPDGTTYTVPCDTAKPVSVNFSGIDYHIAPEDWIAPRDSTGRCASNIYGIEAIPGAWLLGDVFLKNVYAVFDLDGKRIGFAKRTDAPPSEKTSAGTPTSSGAIAGTAAATASPAQVSLTSAAASSLQLLSSPSSNIGVGIGIGICLLMSLILL